MTPSVASHSSPPQVAPQLSKDKKYVEFKGVKYEVIFRTAAGKEKKIEDEETLNDIISILSSANIQTGNVDLSNTILTKDGLKASNDSTMVRDYTDKLATKVDLLFKKVIQVHFKELLPVNKNVLKADFDPKTEFPPLGNIGNSCYMDATLELLLSVKDYLKQRLKDVKLDALKQEREKLLLKYVQEFIEAADAKHTAQIAQAQKKIYDILPRFEEFKQRGGQQDAPAFLLHILDVLGVTHATKVTLKGVAAAKVPAPMESDAVDNPISILSANIRVKSTKLEDILTQTTEKISDSEKSKIHDTVCKNVTRTTKLTLKDDEDPSDVIFVQLGRSGETRKITKAIDLPQEGESVNLRKLFDVPADDPRSFAYEVVGVVNHSGSKSGGHYVAKVKHEDAGNWHYCDDLAGKNRVVDGLDKQDGSGIYLLALKRVKKDA